MYLNQFINLCDKDINLEGKKKYSMQKKIYTLSYCKKNTHVKGTSNNLILLSYTLLFKPCFIILSPSIELKVIGAN